MQRFGRPVYLDTDEGINLLGNTVEANAFSVNPEYYGYHGIHNNGHNIISLSLDPRNELGIPPGKYIHVWLLICFTNYMKISFHFITDSDYILF